MMNASSVFRSRTIRPTDENGALLLLALMFMVATSLVVTGLLAWSGNDITNVGHLKAARNTSYASQGAIEAAIWNVRFAPTPLSNGEPCPKPATSSVNTYPAPAVNGQSIYVWCSIFSIPGGRGVTFFAYPCDKSSSSCTSHPYAQADVTIDDLGRGGVPYCPPPASQASSCGSAATVNKWVVQPSTTG